MMRKIHRGWIGMCAALLAVCLVASATADDIVIENARFRLTMGENSIVGSLVDKASGEELAPANPKLTFVVAWVDEKVCYSNRARLEGCRLVLGLTGGVDTELVYSVDTTDDWIVFRLEAIRGARPSRMILARVTTRLTEHIGGRLGGAWNERWAVCLRCINLQTEGRARAREDFAELSTSAQDAPGPKLEGSGAALIVTPTNELDAVLARLAVAFDLPRNQNADGLASRRLPLARQSYWFVSFAEAEVDRMVDYCRQTGIRQVMLSSGAWCASPGHYVFKENAYPEGVESLRRTVKTLHDAGILVGMHCFASKVSKRDPYVTPVPDRRFWVDMTAELADDIDAEQTTIRMASDLSQWPGSPVCSKKTWEGGVVKHQEVILDDEIIRYESIGPEGKWNTFLGCQRGSWGTAAAAHQAGTTGRHCGVDGCINGYIVDQETDLIEETTSRLAEIFNQCDFDMIYFDGGEDVDRRRFMYYSSNFQAAVMRKIDKRPIIHMGTVFTHGLFHSFTRSATVDTYLNTLHGRIIAGAEIDQWPTVRDHINRSVKYMLRVAGDRVPGELGWFGIWPKGPHTEGLQLDEIEYLMVRSLAFDAPISLETSFRQMQSHPLTPGILEIVRAYEQVRQRQFRLDEELLGQMRTEDNDFIMFRGDPADDKPEFIAAERVEGVGGTDVLRCFAGPRGNDTVATVWHHTGDVGRLWLDVPDVRVVSVDGQPIALERQDSRAGFPVANRRTTLLLKGMAPAEAAKLLRAAAWAARPPRHLWIQAEEAAALEGQMAPGTDVKLTDPAALGDFVLSTVPTSPAGVPRSFAEYRVDVPHEAVWTLWARVRYPTGGDMSLAVVPKGEAVTLGSNQVLGNCGQNNAEWHWTGRGGGTATPPPGAPVRFRLKPGPFVFRIYPRESPGVAEVNPRLDVLCLTDDMEYRPSDEEAREAMQAAAAEQP